MTIGLAVRGIITQLGGGGLLHCFCSTIAVNLESNAWGSRFPALMKQLYEGVLPAAEARRALDELEVIRTEFARLPPELVVWDAGDRSKVPPWGTEIGPHIKSLADYFVTDSLRNLLDVIEEVLHLSVDTAEAVRIVPVPQG